VNIALSVSSCLLRHNDERVHPDTKYSRCEVTGEMKYLVLQGSDDQIAPPENGALLKQELGERATLVSFPGAGHLFM
jgi:pimeloyl-ACP methyl ester carboxylesterase